jgi:hypothetical protein
VPEGKGEPPAGEAGESDPGVRGHGGGLREAQGELVYESDPEDCRTLAEKAAYEARLKRWNSPHRESPQPKTGGAHDKAVEDLVALVARRKKVVEPKGGPGVEIKLDLER